MKATPFGIAFASRQTPLGARVGLHHRPILRAGKSIFSFIIFYLDYSAFTRFAGHSPKNVNSQKDLRRFAFLSRHRKDSSYDLRT
jgi:hypothetical protein